MAASAVVSCGFMQVGVGKSRWIWNSDQTVAFRTEGIFEKLNTRKCGKRLLRLENTNDMQHGRIPTARCQRLLFPLSRAFFQFFDPQQ